jgi:dihydrodipicolinate synthase/N-acetylneuraminate lyase
MRRLQGASFATYIIRYCRPVARGGVVRALYALGALGRLVVLTMAGRRELARATTAIVKGVLTRRAYVGGVEVARARLQELELVGDRTPGNRFTP